MTSTASKIILSKLIFPVCFLFLVLFLFCYSYFFDQSKTHPILFTGEGRVFGVVFVNDSTFVIHIGGKILKGHRSAYFLKVLGFSEESSSFYSSVV